MILSFAKNKNITGGSKNSAHAFSFIVGKTRENGMPCVKDAIAKNLLNREAIPAELLQPIKPAKIIKLGYGIRKLAVSFKGP